jgi:hypothetical protein
MTKILFQKMQTITQLPGQPLALRRGQFSMEGDKHKKQWLIKIRKRLACKICVLYNGEDLSTFAKSTN